MNQLTYSRAEMIRKLIGMGVDNADASIITDYARDRGPHPIPGYPDLGVFCWVLDDLWTIQALPSKR
jgi:hypothetical protein